MQPNNTQKNLFLISEEFTDNWDNYSYKKVSLSNILTTFDRNQQNKHRDCDGV